LFLGKQNTATCLGEIVFNLIYKALPGVFLGDWGMLSSCTSGA
jgi:hypothetical protein